MYNVNTLENICMEDSYVIPPANVDCNFSQEILAAESIGSSVCSSSNYVANDLPLPNEFLQNLCSGYGYNIDVTVSEVCDDGFLQEYAAKCGYQLTEDFLSIMRKHRIDFIDKVDSISSSLSTSFSIFFKGLECRNRDMMSLINRSSSCFSRRVYRLRPKCVDILQSVTVPAVVKSIFDSKVIDGSSERKMTYIEMERLFLYFITALENYIMSRIMIYWRNFCSENNIIFREYGNPFNCAYRFYGVSIPNIDYPASFTIKLGECISFMAVYKINEIVNCFVVNLDDELKNFFFLNAALFVIAVMMFLLILENYLKNLPV